MSADTQHPEPPSRAREVTRSEAGKNAGAQLQLFDQRRILELLLEADGRCLDSRFVENKILQEFRNSGHWHVELDDIPPRGHVSFGRNRIHWARKKLVDDGLLVPAPQSPSGDYLLMVDLDTAQQKLPEYVRQSEGALREPREDLPKGRSRRPSEAAFSDTVYVIVAPARPGWCKVGSGIGDCLDRLDEARRWTRDEARPVSVTPVGRGNGFDVEKETHRLLRKDYEHKLEWFRCLPESVERAIREAAKNVEMRRSVQRA